MSFVYTGIWINWSHGAVAGPTITLNQRDGGLLTAFLAIFVSAAGAATWKIVSYYLHQYRARQRYQDALHHQQQAILRNSESTVGASWQFLQLTWYWRSNAPRYLVRTLPFAGLALSILVLFSIAGVLSSEVTKAPGNETLIRSPHCGLLNLTEPNSQRGQLAYRTVDTRDTLAAAAYERACYDNAENSLQCGQFIKKQLPWTSNLNASCPFSPEMCLLGSNTAYRMDTGMIDSHDGLGINGPKKDRVQYRKVTTCSPIQTKGYATVVNDTQGGSPTLGDRLIQYFYGNIGVYGEAEYTNYSYQYNSHSLLESYGYSLTSLFAYAGSGPNNSWHPIVALKRSDADVSLFFLAPNSVWYEAPVNDPFFLATTPTNITLDDGTNLIYYQPDRFVNVLGCVDQHQLCNPATEECTALTAWALVSHDLGTIGLNDVQINTALRLGTTMQFLTTYASVNSRGANALRASETVHGTFQIALPDNQWITEVSAWFAVSLAKLQQKTIQYATGPSYASDGLLLVAPLNEEQRNMCKNQMVRSQGGTISFSVLGVCIILVLGGTIIATSVVIDTLVGFIRRTFHWKEHKSLQWILDGKLQLQRLAYEEAGQGHWSGCASSVPVTEMDDKIGVPKHVDPMHPRLSRISGQPEQTDIGGYETAEAEGLMTQKQMGYRVEPLHVQDTV